MENLIKKLEQEVGLTHEQAIKTVSVIKDFMDKEGIDIDWEHFFKGKYNDFLSKVKSLYGSYSEHAEEYSNKIADKVEDIADQAKKTAKDLSDKASNLMKGED